MNHKKLEYLQHSFFLNLRSKLLFEVFTSPIFGFLISDDNDLHVADYNNGIVFLQVPFFLFIIFTVYTMLPFPLWYAVLLSVISSVSHIIVLTLYLIINSDTHPPYLANQVKPVLLKPNLCLCSFELSLDC